MKKFIREFLMRGLVAGGFGPMVLAVLYMVLRECGVIGLLTVEQVCLGIVSLTVLAFLAGGMNAVYQIERLPLMLAILIHGAVLYAGYLATYLINDWLEWGWVPVLAFTGIFIIGYLVIWAVIYAFVKKKADKVNEMLKKKREEAAE